MHKPNMVRKRNWIVVGALVVVILVLLTAIQKNIWLKVPLEPDSQAEINWLAEEGMWFGGTYEDNDGDGEVSVRLPDDTTLITIGREFGDKSHLAMITLQENRALENLLPTRCPIILAQNNTSLLNICKLPTDGFSEVTEIKEPDMVHGEIMHVNGFLTKNASGFLAQSPSVRYASIELLDGRVSEQLPTFTGSGRLVDYDELFLKWAIFSKVQFED